MTRSNAIWLASGDHWGTGPRSIAMRDLDGLAGSDGFDVNVQASLLVRVGAIPGERYFRAVGGEGGKIDHAPEGGEGHRARQLGPLSAPPNAVADCQAERRHRRDGRCNQPEPPRPPALGRQTVEIGGQAGTGLVTRLSIELLRLDDALEALAKLDARKARVVELRFFAGLGVEETAQVLKISAQSVMRDWRLARSWLAREMERH